jgi:HTH-type transcriptional regulator/antitoxin MqsA
MSETRIHPETGRNCAATRARRRCASVALAVDVPGWYPEGDGDAIHSGEDLRAYNEAFKELREAYAARIKTVRKKLGLTQEEAGVIIGGGKRAFQKYESGRTPPSDAAVGLIEILARHPEEVATLRSFRMVAPKQDTRSAGTALPVGKRIKRGLRNAAA